MPWIERLAEEFVDRLLGSGSWAGLNADGRARVVTALRWTLRRAMRHLADHLEAAPPED